MMQTTQTRAGNHRGPRIRFLLDRPTIRSVFVERVVDAVLLKVSDVVSHQPPQVSFVERDDMVQQFAATTSNPAFRDAVLPRRCDARPLGLETRRLEEVDNIGIEFGVAIEDDITVRACLGKVSRSCWTTHSAVGCAVTFACRILRRPCTMTKKQ